MPANHFRLISRKIVNLICNKKFPDWEKVMFQSEKHTLRHLTKANTVAMATRDPNIIVFVIIHGNKLYDGDYF